MSGASRSLSIAVAVGALSMAARGAVLEPLGGEMPILTGDVGAPGGPAIDSEGRFLALFGDYLAGELEARGWDGGLLPPFSPTPDMARGASVAATGSQSFAIAWSETSGEEFDEDIYFRRFTTDGTPLATEVPLSVEPSFFIGARTAIAAWAAGIVAVWEVELGPLARFVPDQGIAPPPLEVPTVRDNAGPFPTVAVVPDGRTLVAWRDGNCAPEDPAEGCVRMRHFSADGLPTGTDPVAHEATAGEQTAPHLAGFDDGFLLAWSSDDCDGGCIRGRRFDGEALAVGDELRIDLPSGLAVASPSVATLPTGEFVVVWLRYCPTQGESTVLGRVFDAADVPLTGEIPLNETPTLAYSTGAAMNAAGDLVVTWSDELSTTGRRFRLAFEIFADGFESGDTRRWTTTVE
jgi:hypothetical protein